MSNHEYEHVLTLISEQQKMLMELLELVEKLGGVAKVTGETLSMHTQMIDSLQSTLLKVAKAIAHESNSVN